jgi:hypothetical protein
VRARAVARGPGRPGCCAARHAGPDACDRHFGGEIGRAGIGEFAGAGVLDLAIFAAYPHSSIALCEQGPTIIIY